MRALVFRENEDMKIEEIQNELEEMSVIVDGYLECFYPFENNAFIICNEEGRINGKCKPNRAILDKNGEVLAVVYGNFIVAGMDRNEEFCDVTDTMIKDILPYIERV